jgi:hypothetical protein
VEPNPAVGQDQTQQSKKVKITYEEYQKIAVLITDFVKR